MQLIFKYDLDRLNAYAANTENNIKIVDEHSYIMLCFPEVGYFNYAIHKTGELFTEERLDNVSAFYLNNSISKHKILVEALSVENNALLSKDTRYKLVSTIAKTTLAASDNFLPQPVTDLQFIRVDNSNIKEFTEIYLNSFEAVRKENSSVYDNFKTLLNNPYLDLFLLQYNEVFVGVNMLYRQEDECMLAAGALLPAYRNKGFHKKGLSFRIQQALKDSSVKNIVSWAYDPSVSLQNMLKLNMQVQEKFNVYEYCR